jgi:hypothetical protein
MKVLTSCAHADEMPDTPLRNAGTIPPLAFTAVDDLTGWLQGHVSVLQQSSGESSWKSSRMLRPTSSPESQHRCVFVFMCVRECMLA